MATVHLPRSFVVLFPGAARQLEVESRSVLELIERLDADWPGMRNRLVDAGPSLREHINVFVDGERATLGTRLRSGSVVHVIPAIAGGASLQPAAPGTRIVVPPASGRAVVVGAGRTFRVVDVQGGQFGDLFAFNAHDLAEHQSAMHTRMHVNRLFPRVGEAFVTNRRRPILTFLEDTSPGAHDLLMAPCDPTRYRLLGVEGWHASCQENLGFAMAELGLAPRLVPQPINLFMNTPVLPDGSFGWLPSPSRPGDHVAFRAEMDAVIVLTSCAQDRVPINKPTLTELAIELP